MEHRKFGPTDITVSVIGIGGWELREKETR
jgi:aryl-alcohol dehydrogenase-like predicted oxidoreductase